MDKLLSATTPQAAAPTDHAVLEEDGLIEEGGLIEEDLLVEDVSIDGMCGVY